MVDTNILDISGKLIVARLIMQYVAVVQFLLVKFFLKSL